MTLKMLFPIENYLTAIPFFHDIESFLKIVGFHSVGNNRQNIQSPGQHHFNLIPGLEHFATIYSF